MPPWLIGLCLLGQVPPPLLGNDAAQELEAARRSSIAREAAELNRLAEQLARLGKTQAVSQVRGLIPRPAPPDGATRLMPLPEVVERGSGDKEASPTGLVEIRNRTAAELFELAQRRQGRVTAIRACQRVPPRSSGTAARSQGGAEAPRLRAASWGLGQAVCRWGAPKGEHGSSDLRLATRGLDTAPRPRRVARAGCFAAEEGAVAPHRGG